MNRTLPEWNKYLEDVKRLRDKIHEGTKTTEGIDLHLDMEDCDIIWDLLNSEANAIFSRPMDFKFDRKLNSVMGENS